MAPKSASAKLDYLVFSPSEQLNTSRELLRARETEHYRAWLTSPDDDATAQRLEPVVKEIKRLQAEVKGLENEVADMTA